MEKQIAKTVLLTGAGFTKNLGGFLSNEMWAKIFNCSEVQNKSTLKNILLNDFDYESVYHKVYGGDDEDEKRAINTAIFEAYNKLDVIAQNYIPATDASKSAILHGTRKIIDSFTLGRNQINFFFTLNQDLFIERLISDTKKSIMWPGIGKRFFIPNSSESKRSLGNSEFIPIPADDNTIHAADLRNNEFHYIKLHGSFGWKSSDPDRSDKLVIGRDKEKQIADEPLLKWYFDLFQEVLFQGGIKLLIIGYGFRDSHINEVILEAIAKYSLNLYVLSPADPAAFKNELCNTANGDQIFEGLSGYFQSGFVDLFPPDGSNTQAWAELQESYFND